MAFERFNEELSRELRQLDRKIGKLLKKFDIKQQRSILRKGAAVLRKAARANIKNAKKPVKRYRKISSIRKAAKGKGVVKQIVAVGNLKRSIATMRFKRDKTGLYVGAKLRGSKAEVIGQKVANSSGYYAHFLEFGTIYMKERRPFMRPALRTSRKGMRAAIIKAAREKMEKALKESKLK